MTVSVIVTTYNRPDALIKVMNGLAHQTHAVDEVIIADDGSTQETRSAIARIKPKMSYPLSHVCHEDRGFRAAKIRNDAIRISSGDYIILLDGDCIPHRHFVKDHFRLAKAGYFFQGKRVLVEEKVVSLFKWWLVNKPMALMKFAISGGLSNVHHLIRCPWWPSVTSSGLSGTRSCNMGLFRTDLFAVNGFNEDFVGWGREDSELVARLYAYGLKRKTHPFMAICFHLWHHENSRERLEYNDELLRKALICDDFSVPHGLVKKN